MQFLKFIRAHIPNLRAACGIYVTKECTVLGVWLGRYGATEASLLTSWILLLRTCYVPGTGIHLISFNPHHPVSYKLSLSPFCR